MAKNSPSAYKYENSHDLSNIAFGNKILDGKGNPVIPFANEDIKLENGLNNALLQAYNYKNRSNAAVDIKVSAIRTNNNNYKINLSVSVSLVDEKGNCIIIVPEKSGIIAFACASELGDFGFGVNRKTVNETANHIINQVLNFPEQTRLVKEE